MLKDENLEIYKKRFFKFRSKEFKFFSKEDFKKLNSSFTDEEKVKFNNINLVKLFFTSDFAISLRYLDYLMRNTAIPEFQKKYFKIVNIFLLLGSTMFGISIGIGLWNLSGLLPDSLKSFSYLDLFLSIIVLSIGVYIFRSAYKIKKELISLYSLSIKVIPTKYKIFLGLAMFVAVLFPFIMFYFLSSMVIDNYKKDLQSVHDQFMPVFEADIKTNAEANVGTQQTCKDKYSKILDDEINMIGNKEKNDSLRKIYIDYVNKDRDSINGFCEKYYKK